LALVVRVLVTQVEHKVLIQFSQQSLLLAVALVAVTLAAMSVALVVQVVVETLLQLKDLLVLQVELGQLTKVLLVRMLKTHQHPLVEVEALVLLVVLEV
jgi:hypothetical protein